MKWMTPLLILAAFLLLAGAVLAMSSEYYRLDWLMPLTGSGGSAGSTHYAVHFTVGQTAIGTASSTSYVSCLGYWCGATAQYRLHLPLVVRNQ